jgi:hypothetical protein
VPRTVRHARLESRSARARLKRGRQPHWQALVPGGRWHIGYQHWKGDAAGRWVMRRYIGGDKYRVSGLGLADDEALADGVTVLSFEQAVSKANTLIDTPASKVHNLTVRQAMDRYVAYKRSLGQPVSDVLSRGAVSHPACPRRSGCVRTDDRHAPPLAQQHGSAAGADPAEGW